jgi:hypothetical protein
MSELINPNSATARQIVALLSHYGFDLRGYTPDELAVQWLNVYHEHWVRLAVIEALYQGRYKSISIEQILNFWARRQHPIFHFNHDFERLICRKLPRHLTDSSKDADEDTTTSISQSWLNSEATTRAFQPAPAVSEPVASDPPVSYLELALKQHNPPSSSSQPETDSDHDQIMTPESSPVTETETQESEPEPIHRFTPPPDASGCYRKLKAVAHQSQSNQETA